MFYGTVQTPFIQQMFEVVDFENWKKIYVCCSGTFKVDRSLRAKYPDAIIIGNDVSLYSTAIGSILCGNELDFKFIDRLEFVEDHLASNDFEQRVAAMLVAFEMSRYKADNHYCRRHFDYYKTNFDKFLKYGLKKLGSATQDTYLDGYFAGDWIEHIEHAIQANAGIVAFPPFFKGDYESQFRFLETNVQWSPPKYKLYDPENFQDLLTHIHESGAPYCLLSDQLFDSFSPNISYKSGRSVHMYGYSRSKKTSIRRMYTAALPVSYDPLDVTRVNSKSKIKVYEMPSSVLDFFKDVYLSKKIIHTAGTAGHYLITIDGMTVGGLVFQHEKYGGDRKSIYLLSDVTLPAGYKVSKMVARLALSREFINIVEAKIFQRINYVSTTARTTKSMSMKYRGIYQKTSIRPDPESPTGENIIQYGAPVTDITIQGVFRWWYRKFVKKQRAKDRKLKEAESNAN